MTIEVKEQATKCIESGRVPAIHNELYIDNKKVTHIIPRLYCLGCPKNDCEDRKGSRLKRNKPPRLVTPKTRKRNGNRKKICIERGKYLKEKYGYIPDEFTGEAITVLSSVPHTFKEGREHHIDSNRRNCSPTKFSKHYIIW